MDCYHIWCNLPSGTGDLEFAANVRAYLGKLQSENRIAGFRITRCKLGLRPPQLREWHITIDVEDLAQLQAAFDTVAARRAPIEGLHHAVNRVATDVMFALYRDFPDGARPVATGEEVF